jgi:hypothetical protein
VLKIYKTKLIDELLELTLGCRVPCPVARIRVPAATRAMVPAILRAWLAR